MSQMLGGGGKQTGKEPSLNRSSTDKHLPCTVVGTGDRRVDEEGVPTQQGSRKVPLKKQFKKRVGAHHVRGAVERRSCQNRKPGGEATKYTLFRNKLFIYSET